MSGTQSNGDKDDANKIPCRFCGKEYAVNRIKQHETVHSERNIQCTLCHKKFRSETKLQLHMKSVHAPDDQKPFQCSLCGKGFLWGNLLEEHMNTHTGNKPYQCEMCSSAFQNKSNLGSHMRKKHGVLPKKKGIDHYYDEIDNPDSMLSDKKPCKCRYCPISFANSSNRNAHEKKRHKDIKPQLF